jgi:hypothetical protein
MHVHSSPFHRLYLASGSFPGEERSPSRDSLPGDNGSPSGDSLR